MRTAEELWARFAEILTTLGYDTAPNEWTIERLRVEALHALVQEERAREREEIERRAYDWYTGDGRDIIGLVDAIRGRSRNRGEGGE